MNDATSINRTRREPMWRVFVAALLASALLLAAAPPIFPSWDDDSLQYWYMAQGRWDLVIQPFSSRFLHARLVGMVSNATGMPLDAVFMLVGVGALVVSMLLLALLLRRLRAPVLLLVPASFGSATLHTLRVVNMPDQFYTLLLAGCLLLLSFEQLWSVAIGLLILFCARESTLVLAVVMIAVIAAKHFRKQQVGGSPQKSLMRRKPLFSAAVLAIAMLVGMIINRHVSSKSAPNVHNISPLAYLVGKPPYNFCKNVLGIEPWTNTLFRTLGTSPMVHFDLPPRLRLGNITQIGIADISIRYPAHWILSSLTTFGVLLTTVVFNFKARAAEHLATPSTTRPRFWRRWLPWISESALAEQYRNRPLVWQIALVYGALNLLIVPLLGTAVHRYIYYAWPAFWIVGVDLLGRLMPRPLEARQRQCLLFLLLIHLMLLWMAVFEEPIFWGHPWLLVAMALAALALHVIAWRLIARLTALDAARQVPIEHARR